MTSEASSFSYVDLFSGIGGFAAALECFGGECVYAVETDEDAARVYRRNWGHAPNGSRPNSFITGDITEDADGVTMNVPEHDLLVAGFPCQPFSKSGAQQGMEDQTRGTLYWNILKIIQVRKPTMVLLENVRNLAGPRHEYEWNTILSTLRAAGYRVSGVPTIVSPHQLPRSLGGRPQARERVFIAATYDPGDLGSTARIASPITSMLQRKTNDWDLFSDLPMTIDEKVEGAELTTDEVRWINAWNEFVKGMWPLVREGGARRPDIRLPGFPLWVDNWIATEELLRWMEGRLDRPPYDHPGTLPARWADVPRWKRLFLMRNAEFYTRHRDWLDRWISASGVRTFPPSRRKLEWQAQETASLWECVLQLRPSGIRAKRPTHLPALVAITQTSIIGPLRRRLSVREAARLQGLPDNFEFGDQTDAATYKQLGNGVNVGVVSNVLRAHATRDAELLRRSHAGRKLHEMLVLRAPSSPDEVIKEVVARRQQSPRDTAKEVVV